MPCRTPPAASEAGPPAHGAAPPWTIGPLQPGDVAAARALLVRGLTQRWGAYRAELNPDVAQFPAAFGDAEVLVARFGGQVVATGTLRVAAGGQGEIVRMSVDQALQRRGLGSALLQALLAAARRRGLGLVTLETTSSWASAVAFYQRHGFAITHVQGGDTHFRLDLEGPAQEDDA